MATEIMRGPKREGLTLGGIGPDLPAPGKDRFWRIELVKGVDRNPIKVSLMEAITPSGNLHSVLVHGRTVAIPDKVFKLCEELLTSASEYKTIVGDYRVEVAS